MLMKVYPQCTFVKFSPVNYEKWIKDPGNPVGFFSWVEHIQTSTDPVMQTLTTEHTSKTVPSKLWSLDQSV